MTILETRDGASSKNQSDEISLVTNAAFEGDLFNKVLDLVSRGFSSAAILVYGQDTVTPSGNFLLQRGLDFDAVRSYAVDLAVDNAWFRKQWQQPVGYVYRSRDLMGREEFAATRFYQSWLSKWGELEAAVGIVFYRAGTKQLALEIRYNESSEKDLGPAAMRYFGWLSPHLVNSARIIDLRADEALAEREVSNLLELLFFPSFIVDANCRVHNMNTRASKMVHDMDALFVGADGALHVVDPQSEETLATAIRNISIDAKSKKVGLVLEQSERQSRKFLTLIKVGSKLAPHGTKSAHCFDAGFDRIAVIASNGAEKLTLSHEVLWRTFALTSRECEVALSLLNGASISEMAAHWKVSKQTLRNQLSSIMRKTGTNRQAQLLTLLTQLALSLQE